MTDGRRRSDDVASYVRDLIVSGGVAPGEFLRLEPLAQRLGLSVTPVREAMGLLRGEGFVELEPNRGFVVLPLSRSDIEDIYRVHAFVSGELAALASRRLTAEALDGLVALQEELVAAHRAGDAARVERLNHFFHREINRAAGSPRLLWFLRTASRYAPRMFFSGVDGWAEASAHDHEAILTALADHDPDAARTAMADHVRHAGELLARHHESR
ncbi:GntR family transcriptional regulator [Streptomyces sp. NPDC008079]|uniref:GntR family transcriptional regulator n=1 Tax=unclassified Streptomyces TaxID=2593676 RepID=UPI0036EF1D22